jgi:carboxyl-terminal processing protease
MGSVEREGSTFRTNITYGLQNSRNLPIDRPHNAEWQDKLYKTKREGIMWMYRVLLIVFSGLTLCIATQPAIAEEKPDYRALLRFRHALRIVVQDHVTPVKQEEFCDLTVDGMLKTVNASDTLRRKVLDLKNDPSFKEQGSVKSFTLPDPKLLLRFKKSHDLVRKEHSLSASDLVDAGLSHAVKSVDPNGALLTPTAFKELQTEVSGSFGGIGVEVTKKDGSLTVVSPIEDAPAYQANLRTGDCINAIDGKPTQDLGLMEVVKLLRGPVGTSVTLTVVGGSGSRAVTIKRQNINVRFIKSQILEPGYACLRITSFQEGTYSEAAKIIAKWTGQEKLKGLVLDLRNNPGGLLQQITYVTGMFIDNGLLFYTHGQQETKQAAFRSNESLQHFDCKLAVLINEGSASGSELLAGALRDRDRALVFGKRSFGRARVQLISPLEPLDDGYGLRLTTGFYYTPNPAMGEKIDGNGIGPDIEIEEPRAQDPVNRVPPVQDKVVQRALEWLKSDVSVEQYKRKVR